MNIYGIDPAALLLPPTQSIDITRQLGELIETHPDSVSAIPEDR